MLDRPYTCQQPDPPGVEFAVARAVLMILRSRVVGGYTLGLLAVSILYFAAAGLRRLFQRRLMSSLHLICRSLPVSDTS